jgi:uncharacterized protein
VDACARAGATNISGVTFGVRDGRSAYNAALASALADANSQAHALAAAGHFRLGRVQRVEAGASSLPGPMPFARMATAEAMPTQIAPSDVEVRAAVTVTYTIAPGG